MGFAVVAGVAYEHQVQVTKPSPPENQGKQGPLRSQLTNPHVSPGCQLQRNMNKEGSLIP